VLWKGAFNTREDALAARIVALARLFPKAPEPPPVAGARWIPLTRNKFALVDEADFALVTAAGSWRFQQGYARLGARAISLQAFLMQPAEGFEVDHINRDRLDCRRSNLRFATYEENARNQRRRSTNTSGYIGVGWMKHMKKWAAKAYRNKHTIYIGYSHSREEAARLRDVWVRANHGDFGVLNFPLD
jgi:hypothetical protein